MSMRRSLRAWRSGQRPSPARLAIRRRLWRSHENVRSMTQRRRMTLKPRPCRCTRSRQDQVRDDVSSVMTPTRRSVANADTIDGSAQGGEDLVGRRRRQRRRVPLSRFAPPTFRLAPPPAFPTAGALGALRSVAEAAGRDDFSPLCAVNTRF